MRTRNISRSVPPAFLALVITLLITLAATLAPYGTGTAEAASGWRAQPSPTGYVLRGISAVDAKTAWAVGEWDTIVKWNGIKWITQVNGGTQDHWQAVFALDATHVWAVAANGKILFHNGTTWVEQPSGTTDPLYGVTAVSPTSAWAVGFHNVLHWDGTSWTSQSPGNTDSFRAVYALDANNAWAVGLAGIIYHYDGQVHGSHLWVKLAYVTAYNLLAVDAYDANHVWAVGDDGTTVLCSNTGCSTEPSITTEHLQGVAAVDSTHVWAVGTTSTILFRDGSGWSSQTAPGSAFLNGVAAVDASHVWAVGYGGAIWNYGGIGPVVKVLKPNGKEIIRSGSTYEISWEAPAAAVKFNLRYSLDNGVTWKSIASGVTGTSYVWRVPKPTRNITRALVQVSGFTSSSVLVGTDRSDLPFTIEVLKVLSPNGGETLTAGTTTPVTWRINGTARPVALVSIYYSKDGGATWILIKPIVGKPTSMNWLIPSSINSTRCKIKVVLEDAMEKPITADTSNANFTIAP